VLTEIMKIPWALPSMVLSEIWERGEGGKIGRSHEWHYFTEHWESMTGFNVLTLMSSF